MNEPLPPTYPFQSIEEKWQRRWLTTGAFKTVRRDGRPQFYCLAFPPYPNAKLHIGHIRSYSIADATARFRRLRGYDVLATQGYDAFGLPNDLSAREHGCHPADWTDACIAKISDQFDRVGLSYDRERIAAYHEESYYRFTQWLFLEFLKAGLAYHADGLVNWCDHCLTTLADEQVELGTCWRCHQPTRLRRLAQWFVRTTAFSADLLAELDRLPEWPEKVKKIQRHWIGKSEGVDLRFALEGIPGFTVTAFTRHPELVYGIRFLALALDHPLPAALAGFGLLSPQESAELERLRAEAQASRGNLARGKKGRQPVSGMLLAVRARHPLTGEMLPVALANYVDAGYAGGAVVGVPAHDEKDGELAARLGLPAQRVLAPDGAEPPWPEAPVFTWDGSWRLVRSGPLDGTTVAEAPRAVIAALEAAGAGGAATHYRLRDWLISRQRYWGPPIPVVHCPICGIVPVPEEELPVLLPRDVDLTVEGNPLEFHAGFVTATCPRCRRVARRETDTMDTFMNCLGFAFRNAAVPASANPFTDPEAAAWMPADIAICGIEAATTTLFQHRLLCRALERMGHLRRSFPEPFRQILAHELVVRDGRKMSKSLGNAVDPDELIARYGADALRTAILFIASPDRRMEWSEAGIRTCHAFLADLWRLVHALAAPADPTLPEADGETSALDGDERSLRLELHRTLVEVTEHYERYQLNLVVHALIASERRLERFVAAGPADPARRAAARAAASCLLRMLAPLAPHLSEELWNVLGEEGLILDATWPEPDRALLATAARPLVVQLDGVHQGMLETPPHEAPEEVCRRGKAWLLASRGDRAGLPQIRDWLYVEGQRSDVLNLLTAPRGGEEGARG
jgi:leucyl-tRNA synthetase